MPQGTGAPLSHAVVSMDVQSYGILRHPAALLFAAGSINAGMGPREDVPDGVGHNHGR